MVKKKRRTSIRKLAGCSAYHGIFHFYPSEDYEVYNKYCYFDKCFNCKFFSSLDSCNDFCKLHYVPKRYNSDPCSFFHPVHMSYFFER